EDTRYEIGTWDEAEGIKIFYNTFISMKIGLVNMILDVSEKNKNMNVDVVTEAITRSTQRIMGPSYMRAGMGDGGPCHPRDNIALRWLAEELDLGYDIFGSLMHSREKQAENMARKALELGSHIVIIGKAYKPRVSLTNGSYSLLVGHYIEKLGGQVTYYDPNTGDTTLPEEATPVYLIGYWDQWVKEFDFATGSTVLDPWRMMASKEGVNVVHYGNTRLNESVNSGATASASISSSI
ncbi:MAG: hypothetical protein HRT44_11600, partial [Bdellovibrionales bacterium]|nr:hypothetical protein [Bdellovibrionales bacterium]NQZ19886.1 hypothetical protein [Bdellovibrionales bacterium]